MNATQKLLLSYATSCQLTKREKRVLELRIKGKTRKEAGIEYGDVTAERIRQIEEKALRKVQMYLCIL